MKPEAQQNAIAAACGFTPREIEDDRRAELRAYYNDRPYKRRVPNYLGDFEAIRKVCLAQSEWMMTPFVSCLIDVTRTHKRERPGAASIDLLYADAADWAEAYLKVNALWTN